MTTSSRAPLLVLGAAIAATAGGTADAATLVSTAGAGFTPVTIGSGAGAVSSYTFDLDRDGSNDFSFAASGGSISFSELRADTAADTFLANLYARSRPEDLAIGNVKHEANSVTVNTSGTTGNNFAALATNYINPSFNRPTGTLGYLQGDFTAATSTAGASFRLLDFGLVASAVPEPDTWAMMVLGMGGIAAMRRRQKRQEGTSPAAC